MSTALLRQLKSDEWTLGIGIPHASTWLNQRRWLDEDKSSTPAAVKTQEQRGGYEQWN